MGIVYRLISPSRKSYIGMTTRNFDIRFKEHKLHDGCTKLRNAFRTYSPEEWKYKILFESENTNELIEKELEYIEIFDSINNGYNILNGPAGSGWVGIKRGSQSAEHRKNLSISLLGKTKIRTLEHCQKIKECQKQKAIDGKLNNFQIAAALSRKGIKQSPELVRKRIEAMQRTKLLKKTAETLLVT